MTKSLVLLILVASSELVLAQEGLGESPPSCPAPNTDREVSGLQSSLVIGDSNQENESGNSEAVITDQVAPSTE